MVYDLVHEFAKLICVNHVFHLLVAGRLGQPTDEICVEALLMLTSYNIQFIVFQPLGRNTFCFPYVIVDCMWLKYYVFQIDHLVRT